jgi:hypothetical protein
VSSEAEEQKGLNGRTTPDTDGHGADSSQRLRKSSEWRNEPGFLWLTASGRCAEEPLSRCHPEGASATEGPLCAAENSSARTGVLRFAQDDRDRWALSAVEAVALGPGAAIPDAYGVFFAGGGVGVAGAAGVAGVPKSTVGGAAVAFADAVKYFRAFAPVAFAVITVGNWRIVALY